MKKNLIVKKIYKHLLFLMKILAKTIILKIRNYTLFFQKILFVKSNELFLESKKLS